uniref:Uncharacterized protein n=1 Tax=Caenorhabditis japonica TaxID=281687 RepID=A0A8R1I2W0_CAEJA
MPISRPRGTSVKERIAAIEQQELVVIGRPIGNIVIRAKPIPVSDVSQDYLTKEATHLPSIVNPAQQILHENKDNENGMEKGFRKKKKVISLPQLNNIREPPKFKNETTHSSLLEESLKTKTKTNTNKWTSELENSVKTGGYSRIKFTDSLSIGGHKDLSPGPKRTFASLDQRQNGVIINRPTNSSLDVILPPRSKSAQDIDERPENTMKSTILNTSSSMLSASSRSSKDMATQTSKKHTSTASVEFLNCVRSTQTDSVPIVINSRRKSDIQPSLQDIEEREALLEVIEDALGETFDRYSRVRTNQIIANSARKQAQIWRDVKDFLGCHLFPSAIHLANKSSSLNRTAVEIVASIKMYP